MYLGKIVELGPAEELYSNPIHAYTKALISAIPVPDPTVKRKKVVIPGEVPSPINPPSGCAFGHRINHPRYPDSMNKSNKFLEISPNHWVLDCPCCVAD